MVFEPFTLNRVPNVEALTSVAVNVVPHRSLDEPPDCVLSGQTLKVSALDDPTTFVPSFVSCVFIVPVEPVLHPSWSITIPLMVALDGMLKPKPVRVPKLPFPLHVSLASSEPQPLEGFVKVLLVEEVQLLGPDEAPHVIRHNVTVRSAATARLVVVGVLNVNPHDCW